MEENEELKTETIAILVSLLQVAEEHGESHTAEHIKKILEEIKN